MHYVHPNIGWHFAACAQNEPDRFVSIDDKDQHILVEGN
jgi:hypothetical protein